MSKRRAVQVAILPLRIEAVSPNRAQARGVVTKTHQRQRRLRGFNRLEAVQGDTHEGIQGTLRVHTLVTDVRGPRCALEVA